MADPASRTGNTAELVPCCPNCESKNYQFRSNRGIDRRQIRDGKYRCDNCHTTFDELGEKEPHFNDSSAGLSGLVKQLVDADPNDVSIQTDE